MEQRNSLLDEMLDSGPSPGSLILILSRMKEQGRTNDVIRACVRFLPLYPDDVRLRILLGESYAEKGFLGLAQAEFEKAVLMIDGLAPVYRSLAELYKKAGRYAEATEMLRRYAAHCPEGTGALQSLAQTEAAMAFREMRREPLLDVSVEGTAVEEEEPLEELVDFATPTIAELYYSQGRIEAAVQTYERVLQAHPEDREASLRLTELKKMLEPSGARGPMAATSPPPVEERMIAILERWLPRIRELRYA